MADKELNLVVTEERLAELPLETMYYVEKNPREQINFIAHFVQVGGKYADKQTAVKLVMEGRTMADLSELATTLSASIENAAVPKA